MKSLILTSPTSSKNISQASIFYLEAFLSKSMEVDILDLSGTIDFYDPPEEMLKNQENLWQSEFIFDESWIDKYIPECKKEYDRIYASALFSMDIILQGRYVKKYKKANTRAVIGGPAIKNLNVYQTEAISSVFNGIFTENLSVNPNYNLSSYGLKEFVTVVTGTGCDWKKCRFCNSGKEKYSLRNLDEIVMDFLCISELSNSDIMLSSDSIPSYKMSELALKLFNVKSKQKYNLMMRADSKINKAFAERLAISGCADVFLGGEILDDDGLLLINKGITVKDIITTIKNLNDFGIDVQLGLILFLPKISALQLKNQLNNLEEILPYINSVELEPLSVLYNSNFYKNSDIYGIDLYPEKNPIFSAWCYGLSSDIPWGFKDDNDYFKWEKHIDSLRPMLDNYVEDEYWWHTNYIKENWK